jgi:hypothetical protein
MDQIQDLKIAIIQQIEGKSNMDKNVIEEDKEEIKESVTAKVKAEEKKKVTK